jgi:DNA-directed RNA polymerase subunit F
MGEVREVAQVGPVRLDEAPALMEVVRKRVEKAEVKFDRVAAMAHARKFRKLK